MKDTRLIQLLASFSQKEIRRFTDFMHSPYFNKNEKVKKLCDEILKFYPDFEKKLPPEEKLFQRVFTDEKYDYFKFRNYTSDILELALLFLKNEKLAGNNIFGNIALLENLRLHKQEKIYEKELQKAKKGAEEISDVQEFYFLEKYWLKKEEAEYFSIIDPNTHHELAQHSVDAFLEYAMSQLLGDYGLMLHEQMQNNVPYTYPLYDEIMQYCEKEYDGLHLLLKVYVHILRLLRDITNKEHFDGLKTMLRENHDKIPHRLLDKGYLHLIDFCAVQINRLGNNGYLREVHQLNQDILKYNIQTKGNMAYQDFLNMIKIAGVIKEFDWVENFIAEYGPHLAANERENSIQFSRAMVAYYKQEFGEATRYMSTVNFKDPIMKIQVKSNTVRFLFEEKLFDQLISVVESFAHYLRRETQLTNEIISSHEQFIAYVKELIKMELEPDKREKQKRKDELSEKVTNMNTNYFGTRNWLKKKLGIAYDKPA